MHFDARVNPFNAIRSRLDAVDLAFRGLQPQVHLAVDFLSKSTIAGLRMMAFAMAVCLFSVFSMKKTLKCQIFLANILCPLGVIVVCAPSLLEVCIHLLLEYMFGLGSSFWFRSLPTSSRSCLGFPFPQPCCLNALLSIEVCVQLQPELCIPLFKIVVVARQSTCQ